MTETAKGLAHEVQRYGLMSAALVVNRYAAAVDSVIGGEAGRRWSDERLLPRATNGDLRPIVDVTARFAETLLRLLDAGAALVEQTRAATTSASDDVLELPLVPAGGCGEAPVWVHNPTEVAVDVELLAPPLVAGDGSLLPVAVAGRVGGRRISLTAGASQEVTVGVTVPPTQRAAHYHGLLVGSSMSQPVRITLEVADRDDHSGDRAGTP